MIYDLTNEFRERSKGKYYNDFRFLEPGSLFPNLEMRDRNSVYKYRAKQYEGSYARDINLIYRIVGEEYEIPLVPMAINMYQLLVNKCTDLIFNNEWTVRTGSFENDKKLNKLIEKTGAKLSLRQAIANVCTYGDTGIKVFKNGISAILPRYVFKVVDRTDYNKILGICLVDIIKEKTPGEGERIAYIRFEIHKQGWIYDVVYTCESVYPCLKIGNSVDYEFHYGDKTRLIPKGGKWYNTGIEDVSLLNIASINKQCDGAYGESLFTIIEDTVTGIEQRLSIMNSTLNNLTQPLLIVGSTMVEPDQRTGGFKLKTVDGKYLVFNDTSGATPPQQFQQDYKLDNSEKMVDILSEYMYVLSELGKPFLTGEISGGLSTESINNMLKPAIDKASRIMDETYYSIRDAIYALARLNDIDIKKEDLTVLFNIGRQLSDTQLATIVTTLSNNKILSKQYLLEKYYGLDSEQAMEVFGQIRQEQVLLNSDTENKNNDHVDKNDDLNNSVNGVVDNNNDIKNNNSNNTEEE